MRSRANRGWFVVCLDNVRGTARESLPTILDQAKFVQAIPMTGMAGNILPMEASGHPALRFERILDIANQYGGRDAVFVSIHYNSALREGAYGIETYYNNKRASGLAALVHPRVIQAMESIDRGIRQRGYRVLRKNRLLAILIECGFLTNHVEGERASDPHYRQRVARAIASAILWYD
jgi:N-acetylmuramoyl-L-alanine amidase